MARKRKSTPQRQSAFSPKRYLREKVRDFPISHCFCSPDWRDENKGLIQILVCREQPSGKYVVGVYLVDMQCLGVKNALYHINWEWEKIEELHEQISMNADIPLASCEYVLVHNIIYGALDFAEEIGFYPHADFAIAQYILAEDDDNIELIELEFGRDGRPFFVAGPYDDVRRIIRILNQKVGEGNYDFIADPRGF